MFTYTPMNRNKLSMEIEEENRKLNCRGVFVEVLRTSEYKALVYVYRKRNWNRICSVKVHVLF